MAASDTTSALGERIVRALSTATSDGAAVDAVLEELAQASGAQLAILWLLDEQTGLLCHERDWAPGDAPHELQLVSPRLTFAPGVGLPGRVLESLRVVTVDDIAADPAFPRAEVALRSGIRSATAGPLIAPGGALGVIEVFGAEAQPPASTSVEAISLAGRQLGAYLGRRRVEDRLRASEEASASIVQAALDCIVTMDHRGRIVDLNPAAEATLGYDRDAAVGELLADLIIPSAYREAHHRALAAYLETRNPTILGRRLELEGMRADATTFPAELTVTRLGSHEPPTFAGFLRDITDRRTAEQQLSALLEREQAERARAEDAERAVRDVAEVLQHSLLPPSLPTIKGVKLGAVYRAGTAGWEVGGDFYDVFKLARGRWGIAIGDVCGKGPRAAALTAKVRYALRDAAVRESCPSDVLRSVNDLLLQTPDGAFLTAAFATIDVSHGGAPLVTLAVAGHPLPLLVRARGAVESVGRVGTLLGVFAEARAHDVEFRLAKGELLVFYTDGVTEANTADGRFGEPRLAEMLAAARSTAPQRVVDDVDAAVLAARLPGAGDDVAILAMGAETGEGGAA